MKRILNFVLMTTLLCIVSCAKAPDFPAVNYYFLEKNDDNKSDVYANDKLICHLPVQEYEPVMIKIYNNCVYYRKDKQTILKYYNEDDYITALQLDSKISVYFFYVISDKIVFTAFDENLPGRRGSNAVYIFDEKTKDLKNIFHLEENPLPYFISQFTCNDDYIVFKESDKVYVYDIKQDSLKTFDVLLALIYGFSDSSILCLPYVKTEKKDSVNYDEAKYIHKLDLQTGKLEELKIKDIKRSTPVYVINGNYLFYSREIHALRNKLKSPVTALFFDSYYRELEFRCTDLASGKDYKIKKTFWPHKKTLISIQ